MEAVLVFGRRALSFLGALVVAFLIQACAPTRPSRPTWPPPSVSTPAPRSPQVASPPATQAPETRPVLEQSKIREQDLKEKGIVPQSRSKDQPAQSTPGRGTSTPLPDDSSLVAKITPRTPPQRAASLRLTEEGKKLIESGEYAKALARLERTIAIDSTNPYGYYYLAQAHYRMGRYQESVNFLDVAESLFAGEPYWLAEVLALKGEGFRALGLLQRADSSYSQALRLNPGNRVASEGLGRVRGEPNPSFR
ncbi:MAG: tetratricopeptide repeat protein [Candidatus Binatia bacterium]